MGYVFQFEDALHYNEWFTSEPGRTAVAVEKDLLQRVWSPGAPQSVLEVGCGTGLFLEWFASGGHQATGLDPSPYMLNLARSQVPSRVALDRGYAEELPYDDNAFDTVALITVLEFVNDPNLALQEALRVARRHVLLGVFNKYSITTWRLCLTRLWKPSIYRHARFFSVFQLQHMIEKALAGRVPIHWRTCLFFPLAWLNYLHFLERFRPLQWLPVGHFIGMRIDLRYSLRTVQQPVFCEISSGAGGTNLRAISWQTPKEEPGTTTCLHPHHQGPVNSSDRGKLRLPLRKRVAMAENVEEQDFGFAKEQR